MADPDDTPTAPLRFTNGTLTNWIDWALKGTVGGLCAGLAAVATWGFDTEARMDNVERFDVRITKLEAREDGYQALQVDLAVMKTQLASQDKALDHITKLLEATSTR